jgi:hypothetical protein
MVSSAIDLDGASRGDVAWDVVGGGDQQRLERAGTHVSDRVGNESVGKLGAGIEVTGFEVKQIVDVTFGN